ncbi:MAG: DNA repair protein RadC [Planctomycetota bacterium]
MVTTQKQNSTQTIEMIGAVLGASSESMDRIQSSLGRLGLVVFARASATTLVHETGLSFAECERLCTIFELGRTVEETLFEVGENVGSPANVYRMMAPKLRGLKKETFYVLHLDGRHRLTQAERVSEGTLTTSLVHPREVFSGAIRESAAAIIAVHNHPSGNPEPSPEDFEVTRRLARCGRVIGIPLLDHVVIGHGAHVSIRARIEF